MLTYQREWGSYFLARLETRLKIVSLLLLVVAFTGMKTLAGLAVGAVFLLALLAPAKGLSKLILQRFVWVFPLAAGMGMLFPFITPGEPLFVLWGLAATGEGVEKALLLVLRLFNASLVLGVLAATTPREELLSGLQRLKMPPLLISLMAFTLRYYWLLGDEARRMTRAREARCFRKGRSFFHGPTMKALGHSLGSLFLRASGRGERIYYAMLARGYRGGGTPSEGIPPQPKDWLIASGLAAAGVLIRLGEWMDLTPWI